MQDAPLILLDEPTSGLDPLMQQKFVELIQSEQKRGKPFLCLHISLKKLNKLVIEY